MRSINALVVDEYGAVSGFFPAGDLVFPVDPVEVAILDNAVRAALGVMWAVSAEQIEAYDSGHGPARPSDTARDGGAGLDILIGYIRQRLPAFEQGLLAQRSAVTGVELAAFAGTLRITPRDLTARLAPVDVGGRPTIPAVTRTTLDRTMAKLNHPYVSGPIAEHLREHAIAVATEVWRPVIDPVALIPDPVRSAWQVDPDRWPGHPPMVTADITDLVLLAALCAVGPAAETVTTTGDEAWRELGRPDDPDRVPGGGVIVQPGIDVERLDYALRPETALLAVNQA
ncbi:hypothetical protein ACFY36_10290 [Actinoplanes sp. NPDC000266]